MPYWVSERESSYIYASVCPIVPRDFKVREKGRHPLSLMDLNRSAKFCILFYTAQKCATVCDAEADWTRLLAALALYTIMLYIQ